MTLLTIAQFIMAVEARRGSSFTQTQISTTVTACHQQSGGVVTAFAPEASNFIYKTFDALSVDLKSPLPFDPETWTRI